MNEILDQIISNPVWTTIGTALGAAVVALWLAAAWWVYSDAAHRTGNLPAALLATAWIVVSTPLLLPLSLPVYTLVRPHESASQRRTRRLAAQLAEVLEDAAGPACPGCAKAVDPAWQRCPSCTTWLAQPCADCGAWSDRTLAICPFCGSEDRSEPMLGTPEPTPTPRRNETPRPAQHTPAPEGRPLAPARVG